MSAERTELRRLVLEPHTIYSIYIYIYIDGWMDGWMGEWIDILR